ncbi:MAG: hypothetical protein MUD01_00650 [Chloroflexaceae bacterium]|jgi:hypothetical protein|nr:hypothetical protein [Chloroflexaceae bacterium]
MEFSTIISFLTSTGSSSTAMTAPTASKPFTTAFLLTGLGAMVAWGHTNPATVQQAGVFGSWLLGIEGMNLPLWMISWQVVLVLFVLTLGEWFMDEHKNFGPIYTEVRKPAVLGAGLVLQYGLVQGQAAEIVNIIAGLVPPHVLAWLLGPGTAIAATGLAQVESGINNGALAWLATVVAVVWAVVMTVVTWLVARLRQGVVDVLTMLDGDGVLGLMRVYSFAEGGFTVMLMVVLALLPLVALGLFGLTLLSLWLIRTWLERREEQTKIPCATCATPIYPAALFCPNCRQPHAQPRQVGLFGQSKAALATDLTKHRLNLTGRKRCPSCASRLKERNVRQSCTTCGTVTFNDISEANVYLRALDKRLVKTLLVCGGLGLVPIVGLVPGIVYYRLSLIASLQSYIPSGIGCLASWGVRIVSLFLIVLQAFGLGFLSLPAMCLLNYTVYRRVLRAQMLRHVPQAAPAGVTVAL